MLAYGLASAGSDWQEWRVRDVATSRDRDDLLKWVKFSVASWTKDGKGFYVFETVSTNQDGDTVCVGTWTNIVRGG